MTYLIQPPVPCLIYHFTPLDNLVKILDAGALLCKTNAQPEIDISDAGIQARRARRKVEAGPGGLLHEYVPFYFSPKSPMIHRISKQDRAERTTVQRQLVYLVSSVQRVVELNLPFAFTNGHAEMRVDVAYFDDPAELIHLDWGVIQAPGWNGEEERRKRQSEFLIHGSAPLKVLLGFGVQNESMHLNVKRLLETRGLALRGKVRSDWYY